MQRKNILIASVILFTLTIACLEPSEYSLFIDGEQTLVIEGRITDCSPPCKVLVTKSVGGEQFNNYEAVNNAQVKVVNESSNDEELLEFIGNGVYLSSTTNGEVGNLYRLEVDFDGAVYMSSEKITSKPKVGGVYITYLNDLQYGEGYYLYYNLFVNPDSVGYYKVEVTVNDSLYSGYKDLLVFEDRLYKENQSLKLPIAFNLHDTLKMCIYSLSENMYDYYMALSRQTTNLYSNIQPPVVNPSNNLSPSVLGYFQASSVYKLDTVILDGKEGK